MIYKFLNFNWKTQFLNKDNLTSQSLSDRSYGINKKKNVSVASGHILLVLKSYRGYFSRLMGRKKENRVKCFDMNGLVIYKVEVTFSFRISFRALVCIMCVGFDLISGTSDVFMFLATILSFLFNMFLFQHNLGP